MTKTSNGQAGLLNAELYHYGLLLLFLSRELPAAHHVCFFLFKNLFYSQETEAKGEAGAGSPKRHWIPGP